MISNHEADDSFAALEGMIRAAGGYVRASDDLRPRVLDAARFRREELRVRRCVRRLTLVVFVLMALTSTANDRSELMGGGRQLAAAGLWRALVDAQATASDSGDGPAWGLVEAYTELREQQSAALSSGL